MGRVWQHTESDVKSYLTDLDETIQRNDSRRNDVQDLIAIVEWYSRFPHTCMWIAELDIEDFSLAEALSFSNKHDCAVLDHTNDPFVPMLYIFIQNDEIAFLAKLSFT